MTTLIDTAKLREIMVRARLMGKDRLAFPLVDVARLIDELDTARAAAVLGGNLVAEASKMIAELLRTDLLDAERKRLRTEAGELLPRLAEAIGETPETQNVTPDTVPVPGTEIVQ